ncbi:hypothetical protein GRI44_13830 [Altererythrobacter confluentis]|uniref:Uncharacterized protein n=1 Tax=Allopontixanthobacter confluentis TaxID=1849021 RepID=A0A6L7GIT1_9SPHN|nr:hypothetical protein [Allopontixanthobacter confluentis]MXP15829.1 hypothetical protein [Allopontixanthobacter confluentis]
MTKRITHTKQYRPDEMIEIGEDDDASTPLWQIKKQMRARLQKQKPDLAAHEIEMRVNRMVGRGMRRGG